MPCPLNPASWRRFARLISIWVIAGPYRLSERCGLLINESLFVAAVTLPCHTFSMERTKGSLAIWWISILSLQETVTKLSHFPVTRIWTPFLRMASTYFLQTGKSVESIANFCLNLRSIDFLERNFSGCLMEYVVAALSVRLIRYFKVSVEVN